LLVPLPKAEEDLPHAFIQYSSNSTASSGPKWCQTTGHGRLSGKVHPRTGHKGPDGEQMGINV